MNNILLGVTGSVAAIMTDKLATELTKIGDVQIVTTKSGQYFIDQIKQPRQFSDHIFNDEDEWPECFDLRNSILHIDLRRWASILVIAPLDANTLAKIANGICDNLLTCVVRAWDWQRPMILCPAMNTYMWENEPTKQHLQIMKDRGAIIVDPIEKKLACNDIGMGAMARIENIVAMVNSKLRWYFPLCNCGGIPINHHPGAFGFNRRKNHHTGVDLYASDGDAVCAVEDGTVVKIEQFTGKAIGHEWWEDTWGIMVEGASGVVNYGEVYQPSRVVVGQTVKRSEWIGNVKRVLFEDKLRTDIPGHSCSMLHLELYKHDTREFADWHDPKKNPTLLDPTPHLMAAQDAPKVVWTWENAEEKTVG